MSQHISTEQRRERLLRLPPSARETILNEDIAEEQSRLWRAHELNADTIDVTTEALANLLVGCINRDEFEGTLREAADLSEEATDALLKDIRETIITPRADAIETARTLEGVDTDSAATHADAGPSHTEAVRAATGADVRVLDLVTGKGGNQ